MAKQKISKIQNSVTSTDGDISIDSDLSDLAVVNLHHTNVKLMNQRVMPASADHPPVVAKDADDKSKRKKPSVAVPVSDLPLVHPLVDSDAYKISRAKIRKQLNLSDPEPVRHKPRFVTKVLDVKSAQLPLGDMSTVADATEEAPLCIFVRGDKQVSISTSRAEADLYVAGEISTLAWAHFEAFARGHWRMLAAALKISLNEIGFSHGVLIGDNKFCLAAKFELSRRHADSLRSEATQKRIATCAVLIGHLDLWNDSALRMIYPDPQDAELIEAAREARQEISTKELPFSCALECDVWQQPVQIPKVLAARRPPTTGFNPRCEIGKSTGYCTDRRLFHVKISQTHTLENISFDEELCFDAILDVSGKETPQIEVSWTEQYEDKVIIARTLNKIRRVTERLC